VIKHFLFFLIFLSIGVSSFGQVFIKKVPSFIGISYQQAITVSGGYYQGNFSALNNQLSLWGMKSGFPPYFSAVGLNFIWPNRGMLFPLCTDGIISGEFIIPQELNQGDSLKFRMTGNHLITSLWGISFLRNTNFSICLAPGMDWGKLWIKRTMNGSTEDFSNVYVDPLVRLDFRFVVNGFAIGIRGMYRYDVSNARWKSNPAIEPKFPGAKISGLGFQVFAGWGKMSD
jgi:hypothetical protein